ncbi:MAG: MFS transporter [Candidatus Hydrogenedentes bacterium]|nr:MFS transporter [Candidatus Hydrogenedentota bacterium]
MSSPTISLDERSIRAATKTAYLVVLLDMAGLSLIFPLYPSMLTYYLDLEGQSGVLRSIVGVLDQFSVAMGGAGGRGHVVLFGGLLGSLYALLQFLCAPLFGSLSDRYGRRPILLFSTAGMALSYLIWCFAGSFSLLIVSRVVGGLMSGNIAAASAVIADVTPETKRSRGMAMLGFSVGMGFMLGPTVGGFASAVNFAELFPSLTAYGINKFTSGALGALLLAVANFLCVALFLRETRPLATGASAAAQRSINPLALFAMRSAPGVSRTNLIYFIYILSFSGMEFSLTFLAADRLNYGPKRLTLVMLFIGIVLAMTQGSYVRRKSDAIGPKRMGMQGLALCIPGLVLVGYAYSSWVLFLGLAIMSVGSAQVRPCLSALASLYAPEREQGRVLGVFRSMESLARALGPLVACLLYWRLGASQAYAIAAAVIAVPLGIAWTLPKPPVREAPAVA